MDLVIVVGLFIVFLVWRESQHAKEMEAMHKEGALERSRLLNRIMAPDVAIAESIERPDRAPAPVVPLDDDEAFRKAREMRTNGAD